jgi:hypothetical protein
MIRRFGIRGLAVGLFAACATMVAAPAAEADPTGDMSALTAVTGHGTGMVIVSPTSAGQGDFDARVKVNIHDTAPNTTFSVTRAIAAPHSGCANFLTPFDEVATLTTSAGGAGAVEFERGMRHGPGMTMSFDLMLRVVSPDGTTVLQTDCMTIIGKPPPATA